jgi:uncharacterized protein
MGFTVSFHGVEAILVGSNGNRECYRGFALTLDWKQRRPSHQIIRVFNDAGAVGAGPEAQLKLGVGLYRTLQRGFDERVELVRRHVPELFNRARRPFDTNRGGIRGVAQAKVRAEVVLLPVAAADFAHLPSGLADLEPSAQPLTENGLVRIMSHPNYSRKLRLTPDDLIGLLARFVAGTDHEFWPDQISLRDEAVFDRSRLNSSRLVTEIYLLALAVGRGGRLVTFDQGIPTSAVRSAGAGHLAIL